MTTQSTTDYKSLSPAELNDIQADLTLRSELNPRNKEIIAELAAIEREFIIRHEMAVHHINYKQAVFQTLGSTFFTVTFIKEDGSIRVLNGRLGVKKGVKGNGHQFNDGTFCLHIYDMRIKQHRTVNLTRLISLKARGQVITF